jgi:hypothetical protein
MAVESLRGFLILAVGFRVEMHYKQVGPSTKTT